MSSIYLVSRNSELDCGECTEYISTPLCAFTTEEQAKGYCDKINSLYKREYPNSSLLWGEDKFSYETIEVDNSDFKE